MVSNHENVIFKLKSGTLTANRMAVRAIFTSQVNYTCTDPKLCLSQCLLRKHETPIPSRVTLLIATAVAICTMNETSLLISDGKVQESFGNPTEVALLTLVHDMGYDYRRIRSSAPGRTEKCNFNATYPEGKLFNFTSSRKMMSWAIPLQDGGYRLYSKGAGEVILARCAYEVVNEVVIPLNQASINILTAAMEQYSKRGMRCLGIAYRDLPPNVNLETKTDLIRNSDGTEAFAVESDLIFCAFVGIEDPLRPEVPDAINKCYEAGIDVRLVTGDNPNSYSSEYCLSGRYFER
jgi:Cation transport ATPase